MIFNLSHDHKEFHWPNDNIQQLDLSATASDFLIYQERDGIYNDLEEKLIGPFNVDAFISKGLYVNQVVYCSDKQEEAVSIQCATALPETNRDLPLAIPMLVEAVEPCFSEHAKLLQATLRGYSEGVGLPKPRRQKHLRCKEFEESTYFLNYYNGQFNRAKVDAQTFVNMGESSFFQHKYVIFGHHNNVDYCASINIHCFLKDGKLIIQLINSSSPLELITNKESSAIFQFCSYFDESDSLLNNASVKKAYAYLSHVYPREREFLRHVMLKFIEDAISPEKNILIKNKSASDYREYKFLLDELRAQEKPNVEEIALLERFQKSPDKVYFDLHGNFHGEPISSSFMEKVTYDSYKPTSTLLTRLAYEDDCKYAWGIEDIAIITVPKDIYGGKKLSALPDFYNWLYEVFRSCYGHYLQDLFFGCKGDSAKGYHLSLNLADRFEVSFYHLHDGQLDKYTYISPRDEHIEGELPACFMRAVEEYCRLHEVPDEEMIIVFSLLTNCAASTQSATYSDFLDEINTDLNEECRSEWFESCVNKTLKRFKSDWHTLQEK
jgi:hypothetical protein